MQSISNIASGLVSGGLGALRQAIYGVSPQQISSTLQNASTAQENALKAQHALNVAPQKGGMQGLTNLSPSQIISIVPQYAQNTPISTLQGTGMGGGAAGTTGTGTTGGTGGTAGINTAYQMTPQEAAGGAAGIAAYNARIAKLNQGTSETTGTGTTGTGTTAGNPADIYSGGVSGTGQTYPGFGTGGTGTGTTGTGGTTGLVDPFKGPTPNFGSTAGAAATMAATSSPQYQAAQQTYNQAAQQLSQLQQQAGQQNAAILGGRTNLSEAGGEQGLMQNLLASQEAPLTGQEQAAAASMAAATGQQQTQQQGLLGAAGLLSPQAANALGFFYPGQGGTGTSGYLGYGGGTGASGAFSAGQVLGNEALGQQFQQTLAPAYNAAGAILYGEGGSQSQPGSNSLQGFLNQNPGLNPSDPVWGNQLNAWVQGQVMSDPKYVKLGQYLNEFLQTLTPLVGAAGMTTNFKQQIVNSLVDPNQSGQSITEQLGNLFNNIATTKFGSIYGTGQSLANPTSGNSGNTGGFNSFNSSWQ